MFCICGEVPAGTPPGIPAENFSHETLRERERSLVPSLLFDIISEDLLRSDSISQDPCERFPDIGLHLRTVLLLALEPEETLRRPQDGFPLLTIRRIQLRYNVGIATRRSATSAKVVNLRRAFASRFACWAYRAAGSPDGRQTGRPSPYEVKE